MPSAAIFMRTRHVGNAPGDRGPVVERRARGEGRAISAAALCQKLDRLNGEGGAPAEILAGVRDVVSRRRSGFGRRMPSRRLGTRSLAAARAATLRGAALGAEDGRPLLRR